MSPPCRLHRAAAMPWCHLPRHSGVKCQQCGDTEASVHEPLSVSDSEPLRAGGHVGLGNAPWRVKWCQLVAGTVAGAVGTGLLCPQCHSHAWPPQDLPCWPQEWGCGVGWGSARRWMPAHQIGQLPPRRRGPAWLRPLPGAPGPGGLPFPAAAPATRVSGKWLWEGCGRSAFGGSAHSMPREQLTDSVAEFPPQPLAGRSGQHLRLRRWPGDRPGVPGVTSKADEPHPRCHVCKGHHRYVRRGCPRVLLAEPEGARSHGSPSPRLLGCPQGPAGDPGQARHEMLTWAGSILAVLQGRF